MGYWLDEGRYQHEGVTVPRFWVTIALSLLIHGAALFLWLPQSAFVAPWTPEQDLATDRLQVRLTPAPAPTPAPVTAPERAPGTVVLARPPAEPRPASRSRPPPVMTAPVTATPAMPTPPPVATPAPETPQVDRPTVADLSAYVEARRRERGEPLAPPADSQSQSIPDIAANLPRPATGVATQERRRGGGIFEIKRMDYDDAAFEFFGWNSEMGRKTPQLIEVRKGDNSDMRIAVVRRMIVIIREFSKEDFIWRSPRRGEDVVLSARLSDNAALENFLMHEFFDNSSNQIQ
jgi:outer membrane biosynthesis protein TonB